MKKSFRGLLADGDVKQIRLSTNDGLTGYRIVKFQGIPHQPGSNNGEHTLQLFTTDKDDTQTLRVASNTVNFDDPTLLGVVALSTHSANMLYNEVIIFDNMTFNQDIYITCHENVAAASCNFYLELEQVKLDINEATVATLKDMRGRE